MLRISKEYLNRKIFLLNTSLGRPTSQFASQPGEPTRFSKGHICLDKNSLGYALEEQLGEGGTTHRMSDRMTGKEMVNFLSGVMAGITYRNGQLISNGHSAVM